MEGLKEDGHRLFEADPEIGCYLAKNPSTGQSVLYDLREYFEGMGKMVNRLSNPPRKGGKR